MRTIGSALEQQKGFGPGYDVLRIALAISVVAWHSRYVAYGSPPGHVSNDQIGFAWFPGYAILVMFFALSGFLIAASGLRLSLKNFLINRGLRILPALLVEVTLSAFILGPLLTIEPLHDYFHNPQTYRYMTNIVGLVNYRLPGVFTQSPAPEVNSSLWTVPFEYACYAIMATFITLGLLRRPAVIATCAAIFALGGGLLFLTGHLGAQAQPLHAASFAAKALAGRGSRLPLAFMLGIAAYLYRDRLPYDRRLFALCLALCATTAALGPAPWMKQPLLDVVVAPALVYMTVFIGVSRLPVPATLSKGDYSYGVYLYGFPIQQGVRAFIPDAGALVQFCVAIVPIVLFAAFSWHAIERPILTLRRRFSFVARNRLAANDPGPASAAETSTPAAPLASH